MALGSLANVPGLAGYLDMQRIQQQRSLGDLQGAVGMLGAMQRQQELEQAAQLAPLKMEFMKAQAEAMKQAPQRAALELEARYKAREEALGARLKEMEMRSQDKALDRESRERLSAQADETRKQLAQMQIDSRRDMAQMAAALRPPRQDTLVQVEVDDPATGKKVVKYVPQSQAAGMSPPSKGAAGHLTEAEAKGTLFYRQMKSANDEIEKIVGAGFDEKNLPGQIAMRAAQYDATNWAAPEKAQQYAQATEQWAEAYLRLKTGAATNRDEIRRNARAYFPQPGDKPAVIAQKNMMRRKAEQDVSVVAGRGMRDIEQPPASPPATKPSIDDLLRKYGG